MKILAPCMECQKELGHLSFESIFADYYEGAVAYIECSRGHKSAVLLQSQKFEILLESAANALLEGYTIEAASSLSAAYERFFEFSINVFCKKNAITKQAVEDTFKQVSKQSERQIGGFLFLHLITFGSNYVLSKKIPELRNKVVHQGYIPTPEEVIAFGELIYQEIYSITQLLKSSMQGEMQQVIMDDLQSKNGKIPIGIPRATSTGAIFFSLSTAEQKRDFHEALASYKAVKEIIFGRLGTSFPNYTNSEKTQGRGDVVDPGALMPPYVRAQEEKSMDCPKLLGKAVELEKRLSQLDEDHIAPLSNFVRRLREKMGPDAAIPYIDPCDGGVDAEILFLLEAPGRKARNSGFVSMNNPDETAKNLFEISHKAGIDRKCIVIWNTVPWYIGSDSRIRPANSSDIAAGIESLTELLQLLPKLRGIVFVGGKAQKAERYVRSIASHLKIFTSPHPSPLFVNHKTENRGILLHSWHAVQTFLEGAGRMGQVLNSE